MNSWEKTSQWIESGKASHRGKVRLQNEDSALVLEYHFCKEPEDIFIGIYAVADGVGGNDDGEVASNIALRILSENLVKSLIFKGSFQETQLLDNDSLVKILSEAVSAANDAVFRYSRGKSNGAGTTLTIMLVVGSMVCIANVGDSRLYLLSGSSISQITTDHSLVVEMVSAGELNKDEIYTHPQRNIITRCLGMGQLIETDIYTHHLKLGDSFLVCSDGLWEMVRDERICEIVMQSPSPQAACTRLVEEANLNGGVDNVTVVVVKTNDLTVG